MTWNVSVKEFSFLFLLFKITISIFDVNKTISVGNALLHSSYK